MAGVAGLEPVTSAVTGQRSNQLSYTPAKGKLNIKNPSLWVKWETNPKCMHFKQPLYVLTRCLVRQA